MSDATKRALDAAIDDHIRDETGPAIVTGYTLHVAFINHGNEGDGTTGYYAEYPDGQSMHATLGLAALHLQYLRNDIGADND